MNRPPPSSTLFPRTAPCRAEHEAVVTRAAVERAEAGEVQGMGAVHHRAAVGTSGIPGATSPQAAPQRARRGSADTPYVADSALDPTPPRPPLTPYPPTPTPH